MNRQQRRHNGGTTAAAKATHARAAASATRAWRAGESVTAIVYDDVTVYALGQVVAFQPTVAADAPDRVRGWSERRALANLLGTCPTCGAPASVRTAGVGSIHHEFGCDLGDLDPDDAKWFSVWPGKEKAS